MRTPNFKAETHKALTRILSIESRSERERVLASYFQEMYDLGERSVSKAMSGSGSGRAAASTPTESSITREVAAALAGLQVLKASVGSLQGELKEMI